MDRRNKESRASIIPIYNMQQNSLVQFQETRLPSIKVQDLRTRIEAATVAVPFSQRLFRVLFLGQAIFIDILVLFLAIRGLLSSHGHHFHLKKWYPPMLAATGAAGIVAFAWPLFTFRNPSRALKTAFWFSPLLTCAVGIVLVLVSSPTSLAIGSLTVVFAVSQSLYACWANTRFHYAIKVLAATTAFPPTKSNALLVHSILLGIVYSSFMVCGIGGATITGTEIDHFFILIILLSLAWTMQVMKNTLHVTVARIKHTHFSVGTDLDTGYALRDTIKHLMGSISIGSVIVPFLTVIRSSARGIKIVAGGADEFMFSCANCYSAIASTLVTYGNRWGFVQVGVYSKGFVESSRDTWEMFKSVGLESLIDSDLTGSFCFLSGISGGAISALVGGTWTLVVHKSYTTEVIIYAFLIGYFMCRMAMVWPQACISAYYVVYAENPQSLQFDPTIPVRMQELQRYGA